MNHEELVNKIKEELAKLSDVEDEKVKEVTNNIESYVTQFQEVGEESEEDDNQNTEKTEEGNEEPKKESEEEPKEEKSEEETKVEQEEEEEEEDTTQENSDSDNEETGEEIENEKWDTEYINNLPDSAFAVIEPAYLKGDTSDKNARHLPHHTGGVSGSVSDTGRITEDSNDSVDMSHYRNALARAEQIEPITDSISKEKLVEIAKNHLKKHRDLLKSEEESASQLNAQVSEKLEQAAVQLDNYEKELESKDTEIEGYKAKVQELEAELEKYKEQERLELEKQRQEKVQKLVELYSNLGIQKSYEELDANFSDEQIDKLINDFSSVKPVQKNTTGKDKRVTNVTRTVELNQQQKDKKKEITPGDTAKVLFGIE